MSVSLYDKALLDKIRNWTKDTSLVIVGPEESRRLFETVADVNNDSPIKLPLISLKRKGGFEILQTGKQPLTFDGATRDANILKSLQQNAIPIKIPYQIDIYTRYLEEADAYCRNFIFNLINFPRVEVKIPYEDEYVTHYSFLKIDSGVEDNSNIAERLISGQFSRFSIGLYIDDAYLWDMRYRDNYLIDIVFESDDNKFEKVCCKDQVNITKLDKKESK